MKTFLLLSLLLVLCVCSVKSEDDSYIAAYHESHGKQVIPPKNERDYNENPYPYPQPQPDNYGPPSPPKVVYGPPAPTPPAVIVPIYGPPPSNYESTAHGMLSFFEKLKWKLDLFTIGKILLKLVIFKKIVSLIAILCLLLFIPTLKHKNIFDHGDGNDDDDDDDSGNGDERMLLRRRKRGGPLDNMSQAVLEAIEKFTKAQKEDEENGCEGLICRIKETIEDISSRSNS